MFLTYRIICDEKGNTFHSTKNYIILDIFYVFFLCEMRSAVQFVFRYGLLRVRD